MADDYSASIITTGKLTVGGSTTGVVDTTYDTDWFKISLTAGTTYLLSVAGGANSGALNNFSTVELSMYNAQGSIGSYLSTYTSATGAVAQFTAQSSGTYFLSMRSYYTGGYTVKAATPAADDYSANAQTTATLTNGVPASGVFERLDDIDWFKFHADAGQVIGFTGAGVVTNSSYSNATVYDGNGNYKTYVGQAPFIATTSGDYYLAVSAGGLLGAYSQTMQIIADDYANDNTSSAQLFAGSQVSGSIDYYADVDRFKISLEAGSIYTLTLKPQGTGGGAPSLDIYLPSGSYDYQNSGSMASDGSVTLRYQATVSGVYGIGVRGTVVQSYVLSASTGELDDYGNTQATAAALALGDAVSGELQGPRDIDMFKVDLKAGVTYNFALTSDAPSAYNIASQLLDVNGQSLASLGYTGSGSAYSYTPSKDGTYYLSQSNYYANTGNIAFTLTASAATDDFGANTATPGRLSIGGATKGVIESGGDRDWFAVSLNAGGYYWFKLDGAAEGGGTLSSSSYVSFKVLDSNGNQVAGTSNYSYGTGIIVPFTPATKGTYYVEVGSTSNSGSYTVKAQLGKADDYGNDQAHAAAMAPDSVVKGELELATDKDVFKLSVVAGMTYSVELGPQTGTDYYSLNLDVSGPGYLNVRYVSSNDKVVRLFEASASGDYYVTVSASTSNHWSGAYTLVAKSMGIDDFSADAKTTAVLTPAAPLHGVIGVADDHDWIKVHLDAGHSYVFDLKGNKSGGGTLDTGVLYGGLASMTLLTASGTSLAYSSLPDASGGSDPRLHYWATATGDYYLDVRGTGQAGNTGSYTVAEFQANLDTTGPRLLSSSIAAGAIDVGLKPTFTLTFDETIMLGSGVTLTDGYGAVVQGAYGPLLATVAGNTLTVDPRANLMPGMTYTVNLPQGIVVDLAGNSTGSQSFSFTTIKPVSAGTNGNDYLIGSGNGLTLDGGAGTDTVYYASSRSSFNISRGSDGSAVVRDYRSATGDKLAGVERLLFSDGGYALDTDGIGGQAYRLYKSAFNRAPDQEGLGFWITQMDHGMSLKEVASLFLSSPEFARTYGSATSDADLVKLMYQNVLGRAPDAEGNSFWLSHLQSDTTRAELLTAFSESAENQAAVAQVIGNGFAYTPYG
ncbi:DUF4214 domain-containing protein [Duganella sp. FT109W]|uniref:DUF4214 domain-containing protein n=1 Tax=Duganella margarita TaxID=2692170 RepID=A0ABW9WPM9_9BURK|nr:DUF4214 domain-containing protein [Duganella margarita]MYN42846.1 DUF4214 domain-containing protein [Duganella margarita]